MADLGAAFQTTGVQYAFIATDTRHPICRLLSNAPHEDVARNSDYPTEYERTARTRPHPPCATRATYYL